MRARGVTGFASLLAAVAAVVPWTSAWAAFPGGNGRIATTGSDVYSFNPDGSGGLQLTNDAALDLNVAWSPDGGRIAFATNRDGNYEIYVMNADGSGQTRLTVNSAKDVSPSWSPEGSKIAFQSDRDGDDEIFVMDADGANPVNITHNTVFDWYPAWSPDGDSIAFTHGPGGSGKELFVMAVDGSNAVQLTNACEFSLFCGAVLPDWSPDGAKIAYLRDRDNDGDVDQELRSLNLATGTTTVLTTGGDTPQCCGYLRGHSWSPDGTKIAWVRWPVGLQVADADGSGEVDVAQAGGPPSWQPLPVNTPSTHVRPKGATPMYISLVPAYTPCSSPNRTHGPPLAYGSCNPPQPGSTYLTVGVGDGSPALARSVGWVRMDLLPGVPGPPDDSDVRLRFSLTNVMRASNLSDYTGELEARVSTRVTDKDGSVSSTAQDHPLAWVVPCAATSDPQVGGTCGLDTTLDAITPGAAAEGTRAVWALDKLTVTDGGTDEDADTKAGNSPFATQGVFVP